MGANPLNKTKYKVSVTIDGTKVENVSFATKGNTSLSHVASTDSNRYSFKINFVKYEKGQTYQGLDKLNLNNMMADATCMKDYLSYLIMRKAGASAPLTSYVSLSINGELHGSPGGDFPGGNPPGSPPSGSPPNGSPGGQ